MPVDVEAVSSAASSDSEDDHSDEVPKSADADEPVDRFERNDSP